jgi:Caspase domain
MFALIVAIDRYESPAISNLSGCTNDGNLVEEFLKEYFPEAQIVSLYNEEATRARIIATFRVTFQDNRAIQPGDPMLFFYAGHGSRARAPWSSTNRHIETICPHDEGAGLGDAYIHGIPDYTIHGLLCELEEMGRNNMVSSLSAACPIRPHIGVRR